MTSQLSAYEQERLDNIRRNEEHMVLLGLDSARLPTHERKARAPAQKKPPPPRRELPTRARSTAPLRGGLADGGIDANAEAEAQAAGLAWGGLPSDYRPAHESWRHTEWQKHKPCTPAEREALQFGDSWLDDFEQFWRLEGNSDDNRRQVMRVLPRLIAGEGLVAKDHPELGVFLGGERVGLRSDLETLMQRAHLFLPMKSMPTWMQGRFPPPPPGRPRDKSNGWFANHPLQKLAYYQRFLRDQARETAAAAAAAAAAAGAMQPKKRPAPPAAKPKPKPKAAANSAGGGGGGGGGEGGGEDDDEEEALPLTKRPRHATSGRGPPAPTPAPLVKERLAGRAVRLPASVFPDFAPPPAGYWVATVLRVLQRPKGHAMLRVAGEEDFHRPLSEIMTWAPHR